MTRDGTVDLAFPLGQVASRMGQRAKPRREHGQGRRGDWRRPRVHLVVLQPADQLAAEVGVEGVAVIVHQVRVLCLDVRDRVDPTLRQKVNTERLSREALSATTTGALSHAGQS
jgi:hypothetical protein